MEFLDQFESLLDFIFEVMSQGADVIFEFIWAVFAVFFIGTGRIIKNPKQAWKNGIWNTYKQAWKERLIKNDKKSREYEEIDKQKGVPIGTTASKRKQWVVVRRSFVVVLIVFVILIVAGVVSD